MKFLSLEMPAFGPFTNFNLNLDEGSVGFHIIYGHNEAGKTSTLRALHSFLFGIPHQTNDNFLHPNNKLRVGARLRHSDGREIHLIRRKGRAQTLEDISTGQDHTDAVLAPFLGGTTPEFFETFYGINHQALREGGRRILEQKGEIGEVLFGAGLGGARAHEVLSALKEESDKLFLPTGRVQIIPKLFQEYKTTRKKIADLSLRASEWNSKYNKLKEIEDELLKIRERLKTLQVSNNRLTRVRRVFPLLAKRQQIIEEICALGDVPPIAEDFPQRRTKVLVNVQEARGEKERAETSRETLKGKADQIEVNKNALVWKEQIESLGKDLNRHLKAHSDRVDLERQRDGKLASSASLLKSIRHDLKIDEVEKLRPLLSRDETIQVLGQQRGVLQKSIKDVSGLVQKANSDLADAKSALERSESLRDISALKIVIASARKAGEIDKKITEETQKLTELRDELTAERVRLGLPNRDLLQLEEIILPNVELIKKTDEEFADLDEETKENKRILDEVEVISEEAQTTLDEIKSSGDVPTDDDLFSARVKRGQSWGIIKELWGNQKPYESDRVENYEQEITVTDEIADRRYRESEMSHRKNRALAELESAKRKLVFIDTKEAELSRRQESLQRKWSKLWSDRDIDFEGSPREAITWNSNANSFIQKIGVLRGLQGQLDILISQRDLYRTELKSALTRVGKPLTEEKNTLSDLLAYAELQYENIDEANKERTKLEEHVPKLQAAVEQLKDEEVEANGSWDKWKEKWAQQIDLLGLDGEAFPEQVIRAMTSVRDVFSALDEAVQLKIRIDGIGKDYKDYQAKVSDAVEHVEPSLSGETIQQQVNRLVAILRHAETEQTRLKELSNQIADYEEEIENAQNTLTEMEAQLTALRDEAECRDEAEANVLQTKLEKKSELSSRLGEVKDQLLAQGEGVSLEDLVNEADGMEPDSLDSEIRSLNDEIETLTAEDKELAAKVVEERTLFKQMDGSGDAADAAQNLEGIESKINAEVEKYVQLIVAGATLRHAIEKYRKQHEGTLLHRASEIFSRLSLGSFSGLRIDYTEDSAFLVGERDNGERIYVDAMSDGARDQLFLALRIATVEQRLKSTEPMPMVIDDILVNFDDPRTQVTLEVLQELSNQTQVLVFTHHNGVVEAAKELNTEIKIHTLN